MLSSWFLAQVFARWEIAGELPGGSHGAAAPEAFPAAGPPPPVSLDAPEPLDRLWAVGIRKYPFRGAFC